MSIGEVSWLDFVGLAVAVSLLESVITGVGVTILKGRRTSWRVTTRFRHILGLTGLGLLLLVTAIFCRGSTCFPEDECYGLV